MEPELVNQIERQTSFKRKKTKESKWTNSSAHLIAMFVFLSFFFLFHLFLFL